MKRETWKIYAQFRVTRDAGFEPQTITQTLGISPDEVRLKGRLTGVGTAIWPYNAWVLHSGVSKDEEPETHLDALLPRLESVTLAQLQSLEGYEWVVQVAAYWYSDTTPPLYASDKNIAALARIRASLWFDVYDLSGVD